MRAASDLHAHTGRGANGPVQVAFDMDSSIAAVASTLPQPAHNDLAGDFKACKASILEERPKRWEKAQIY